MKRILLLLSCVCLSMANAGCFINALDSDPLIRQAQLFNWSEDLRQIRGEMARFWMIDQPSHLTHDRVDGGIAPRQ